MSTSIYLLRKATMRIFAGLLVFLCCTGPAAALTVYSWSPVTLANG
jgi:hypothetical protein